MREKSMVVNIVSATIKFFLALILNLLKDKSAHILQSSFVKTSEDEIRQSLGDGGQVQDEREREIINIKNVMIISFLSIPTLTHTFSYDSAIYTAQKGDIKSADEQMRSIVVHSPDDADVLYDAGVLASQLKNFNQAAAYFSRAAQCAHKDKDLCFRSHFNAGNALVDTKDLKSALAHYDAALTIDPENEYARHNRDKVKEMLQEQEKQDQQKNNDQSKDHNNQQDQDDQSDDDKKNDQNESGDENDQQQNNGNDQEQKNGQQNQGTNNNSENGSDEESDQDTEGKQGERSQEKRESEKGKQQGNEKEQQRTGDTKDQKGNSKESLDKNSEQQAAGEENKKQQSGKHQETPQEQENTGDENSISPQDKQEQGQQHQVEESAEDQDGDDKDISKKINDPWLLNVLNDQELHDKAMNKKLMEARIRQHGGKNVQNCW
jgi:hypothetical protein